MDDSREQGLFHLLSLRDQHGSSSEDAQQKSLMSDRGKEPQIRFSSTHLQVFKSARYLFLFFLNSSFQFNVLEFTENTIMNSFSHSVHRESEQSPGVRNLGWMWQAAGRSLSSPKLQTSYRCQHVLGRKRSHRGLSHVQGAASLRSGVSVVFHVGLRLGADTGGGPVESCLDKGPET